MKTASWGRENSWQITENNDVICKSDEAITHMDGEKYRKICKICKNTAFQLYCLDSWGDGWEYYSNDDAYVEIAGKKYCDENFNHGYSFPVQEFQIDSSHDPPITCALPMVLKSDGSCVECIRDHLSLNNDPSYLDSVLSANAPHLGCNPLNPICNVDANGFNAMCVCKEATPFKCDESSGTTCKVPDGTTVNTNAPIEGVCKCGDQSACDETSPMPACLLVSNGAKPEIGAIAETSCQVLLL